MEIARSGIFNGGGLAAYWRFEGNSNDSKGSNNGTDTAITYSIPDGKFGQGATFNGSTSEITIPDAAALKPTGTFSIAAWIKTSKLNSNTIFQSFSSAPVAGFYFSVGNTNGKVGLVVGNNTGSTANVNYKTADSTTSVNDNIWHHVAGVYNGTDIRIYVDGVLETTVAWAGGVAYGASNLVRIGCQTDFGPEQNFYNGQLDDLGLWSTALTAAQVESLYRGGFYGAMI